MTRITFIISIIVFSVVHSLCTATYEWNQQWESSIERGMEGPSLWNGKIAYSCDPNYTSWYNDIFLWDGSGLVQLTDTPWITESSPSLFEDRMAYSADPQGIWQEFYWNGEKNEQITFGDGKRGMPSLWGNLLVYDNKETQTDWDVYYYNLDTKETAKISNSPWYDMYNVTQGGDIVWISGISNNNFDVYYWHEGSTMIIPSRAAYWKPSLYDGKIAWAEVFGYGEQATVHIMLWDDETNSKKRLTTSYWAELEPSLFKGMMAFVKADNYSNFQIMFWDGKNIYQVTNDNYINRNPCLYITDSGEIQLAYVRYTNLETFDGQIVYLTVRAEVPEPSTFLICLVGTVFISLIRRNFKKMN